MGTCGAPSLSISLPKFAASPIQPNERSVHSLEKQIMRFQELLKETETEIAALEGSLNESQAAAKSVGGNGIVAPPLLQEPHTPLSTARADEAYEHVAPFAQDDQLV